MTQMLEALRSLRATPPCRRGRRSCILHTNDTRWSSRDARWDDGSYSNPA